jgi:predicted ATPase
MPDPPTGTVTFLFTDIEGSTRLWEQYPEAMRHALARHDALGSEIITAHEGVLVKSRGEGDSLFAVFARASDAVAAAGALQQALVAEPWQTPDRLRVRMALHAAAAECRDGDYYGPGVNRCARLRAVAHGDQVLLSAAVAGQVRHQLPAGAGLRDLGSHRLKDLQEPEHLYQLLLPHLPADFPPLRSLAAFAHNLPVQLTRFIGREREMGEVKRLLAARPLLTLTGSGGCGKTRLALQVAADVLEAYPDGVWLVELAALTDPALVGPMVAAALGVREEPNRPLTQTLVEYLRPRQLLLVVDNCEHLLAASASLVDTLLRSCPHLRVLASSREGLGIAGEQTYRVPSLSVPDPQTVPSPEHLQAFEAVQLFAARAALSDPAFAVPAADAAAVVQICRRLDGIPLAIELAAARVKALPVEQIAARLDDRFRLLTGGSRTALPRQQTLRALIDWSYDLLSEPERVLLLRLSVFAAGWTLEAAEAVCSDEVGSRQWAVGSGDSQAPGAPLLPTAHCLLPTDAVLDLLTTLVEKSLMQYEVRGGEARYWLLETVRQYARDRLIEAGEATEARNRHRDYFLSLPERIRTEPAEKFDRLDTEHDNLRAALGWAVASGEVGGALRLASALQAFWATRGYTTEGRARFSELLVLPAASGLTDVRAWALFNAGVLASHQNDQKEANRLWTESLAIYRKLDNKLGIALSLTSLGGQVDRHSDGRKARALLEESLALWRELGDEGRGGAADSLLGLGRLARSEGDYEAARRLTEESLAIWRELNDRLQIPWALLDLGWMDQQQSDHDAARKRYEESLGILRELGFQFALGLCLYRLGRV